MNKKLFFLITMILMLSLSIYGFAQGNFNVNINPNGTVKLQKLKFHEYNDAKAELDALYAQYHLDGLPEVSDIRSSVFDDESWNWFGQWAKTIDSKKAQKLLIEAAKLHVECFGPNGYNQSIERELAFLKKIVVLNQKRRNLELEWGKPYAQFVETNKPKTMQTSMPAACTIQPKKVAKKKVDWYRVEVKIQGNYLTVELRKNNATQYSSSVVDLTKLQWQAKAYYNGQGYPEAVVEALVNSGNMQFSVSLLVTYNRKHEVEMHYFPKIIMHTHENYGYGLFRRYDLPEWFMTYALSMANSKMCELE